MKQKAGWGGVLLCWINTCAYLYTRSEAYCMNAFTILHQQLNAFDKSNTSFRSHRPLPYAMR